MANFNSFVTVNEVEKMYKLYDNPEAVQYICDGLNERLDHIGYLSFSDYKYYCECWRKDWPGWYGTVPPAWAK